MKVKFIFFIILFIFSLNFSAIAHAKSFLEIQTERYFELIKANPQKLIQFLYQLPKGGDLHSHVSGAVYAENLLKYAHSDNFCINRKTYFVYDDEKCEYKNKLNNAIKNPNFKNALIDSWSMRHFKGKGVSGHDHFFATFKKFGLITKKHVGEMLSEIMQGAGLQNVQYLELMITIDKNESGKLGQKLGWDSDFARMRNKLLKANFSQIIKNISSNLDQEEAKMRSLLACANKHPKVGCKVKVRYLYQVGREQAKEMVFAQLLAGFEAASKDKRILGINMVQPEDGVIAMRDYKLHMQMVGFLHKQYPHVRISLHAGELNSALVPPEGLKFHINDAVFVAHTNRIGHGSSIIHETNMNQLLKEMTKRDVLIEISLSSSANILNIEGKKHPLPLYLKHNVPVTLSTDDEGVSRSNLTNEYQLAVNTFQLSYPTLKKIIRNSITYAFLPGKRLWRDDTYQHIVSVCKMDILGSVKPSKQCKAFLDANEKAYSQWELEKRFVKFEYEMANYLRTRTLDNKAN